MEMLEVDIIEIMEETIPFLNDGRIKAGRSKSTWTGEQLLNNGITVDNSGKEVEKEKGYGISIPILKTVDHEKELRKIISEASSFPELKKNLKQYKIHNLKPVIKSTMWEEFKLAAKERKQQISIKRLEHLEKVVEKFKLQTEKITDYQIRISKAGKPTVDFYPVSGKFNVVGGIGYQKQELGAFLTLLYS